jgi:hypothetical protein
MSRKKASAKSKPQVLPRPVDRKDVVRGLPEETLLAPGADPLHPLRVAFDALLDRAADLLMLGGLKRADIEHALRAQADAFAKGKRRRMRLDESHFGLLTQASGVLHDWWREPSFVGSDGNAKPLPIQGRGATLSALVARRVPLPKVPGVINWMEKAGFFTRDAQGLAATPKRQAIIALGSPGPLMSERGITMAAHALGTAAHNYRLNAKLPGLTDRQAYVSRLSVKHLRQFRELVRLHGSDFLETIDNWLEDHQVKGTGESGIEAGVHLYMFTGRPAKGKRKRGKGSAA